MNVKGKFVGIMRICKIALFSFTFSIKLGTFVITSLMENVILLHKFGVIRNCIGKIFFNASLCRWITGTFIKKKKSFSLILNLSTHQLLHIIKFTYNKALYIYIYILIINFAH